MRPVNTEATTTAATSLSSGSSPAITPSNITAFAGCAYRSAVIIPGNVDPITDPTTILRTDHGVSSVVIVIFDDDDIFVCSISTPLSLAKHDVLPRTQAPSSTRLRIAAVTTGSTISPVTTLMAFVDSM
ncbi:hypothetical protein PRNP1_009333 [Phytophthora ramorum]